MTPAQTLASDRPSATAESRASNRNSEVDWRGTELPQNLQALERANRIRFAIAQHKREVKVAQDPFGKLADLIEEGSEGVAHARLDVMLRSIPRMGPVRTDKVASRWGIHRSMLRRQIGPFHDPKRKKPQLTERQRELVVEMLRGMR